MERFELHENGLNLVFEVTDEGYLQKAGRD